MHTIICPHCQKVREVKAKKPWMKGIPPYEMACKSCCQLGKPKSDETREKLRKAIKELQTPDELERKRQFMLEHTEHWKDKLNEGGAEKYCLGRRHTEETKRKIGEGVRKAKEQ